jgi:hypothetical protein
VLVVDDRFDARLWLNLDFVALMFTGAYRLRRRDDICALKERRNLIRAIEF